MIKAIVYNSNTGYTEDYAKLLSKEINVPAVTLEEAVNTLEKGTPVFFFGWIMAGHVVGWKKVRARFDVKGVCGVGLQGNQKQCEQIRKNMGLMDSVPCFQLQGGFDMKKLSGMNKFLMKIVSKKVLGDFAGKESLTQSEQVVKKLLIEGGSCVTVENLKPIIDSIKG